MPLENGDRLSRGEFERRYMARPDLKKAELIEGVVYMPSPVRVASHAEPHAAILGWLVTYSASTPGVRAADNATVRLDLDNEPQPDALFRIVPAAGGRAIMSADDYIDGAPELIVEIAASKRRDRSAPTSCAPIGATGCRSMLCGGCWNGTSTGFVLSDGEYRPRPTNPAGMLGSRVFPGLRLAVDALLQGDLGRVLAELRNGLSTPEHAEFGDHLHVAGPSAQGDR